MESLSLCFTLGLDMKDSTARLPEGSHATASTSSALRPVKLPETTSVFLKLSRARRSTEPRGCTGGYKHRGSRVTNNTHTHTHTFL